MIPDVSSPSISPAADVAPDLTGLTTCPSCHTVHSHVANVADSMGAAWTCARCGQQWDARRLAAVAAYAVWLAKYTAALAVPHA